MDNILETVLQIAAANADSAIDQADAYDDAVASYANNITDTLVDMGIHNDYLNRVALEHYHAILRCRTVSDETAAVYAAIPAACAANDDAIIAQAMVILRHRLREPGRAFSNPADTRDYLTLSGADDCRESFRALWLTSQNALIREEVLSVGTIDAATVYPREVVTAALSAGAAAVIFAHNHPSGCATPSTADVNMTRKLKQALELVDVRVLDHMIITRDSVVSMAERGEV